MRATSKTRATRSPSARSRQCTCITTGALSTPSPGTSVSRD
jgi:hypothetical protein